MDKENYEKPKIESYINYNNIYMLGTLNAKIYNLDSKDLEVVKWTELENIRYFYDFFDKHRSEF